MKCIVHLVVVSALGKAKQGDSDDGGAGEKSGRTPFKKRPVRRKTQGSERSKPGSGRSVRGPETEIGEHP